ncbi:hypothetical protein L210DRAFT_3610268 [Boletus edulis BED1]|uniref:5-hydroxyisourate hydrolase n=1 Tax=Boletus edulis BED1 TaxID=1328754 RepID=A0AAD4GHK1_BOLED|nr:hypothetical protein L210DRAFT_3610268 [Boletus edulis BED1]
MTVLDVSLGKPAEGVHVNLQVYRDRGNISLFDPVSQQLSPSSVSRVTDADAPEFQIAAGIYKVVFKPQEYFAKTGRKCFYPWIEIPFQVENPDEHYHIPLLISPHSFTTYRGS